MKKRVIQSPNPIFEGINAVIAESFSKKRKVCYRRWTITTGVLGGSLLIGTLTPFTFGAFFFGIAVGCGIWIAFIGYDFLHIIHDQRSISRQLYADRDRIAETFVAAKQDQNVPSHIIAEYRDLNVS